MPGKCWFLAFEPDGELIPGKTGEKRRLRELARARTRMHHTINALRTPHEDGVVPTILLFGYGHGAIVAIDAALSYPESGAISGVVAVSGGCLLPEIRTDPAAAGPADGLLRRVGWHPASATTTPVLVHHGISDPSLPVRDAEAACSALKSAGVQVEWAEFARGAEPPKDEREMRRIFEFLAPKLQLPSRLDEMAKEPDTTLIDVTGIVPNPTDSAGMHTV
jgi:predicted esterase